MNLKSIYRSLQSTERRVKELLLQTLECYIKPALVNQQNNPHHLTDCKLSTTEYMKIDTKEISYRTTGQNSIYKISEYMNPRSHACINKI